MKKILSREAVKRIDNATIENPGINSIDLMENAATAFVNKFLELYQPVSVTIISGPGNNGGDGLAVARLLDEKKISVKVYYLKSEKYSEDFQINLKRLGDKKIATEVNNASDLPTLNSNEIIIDALYGTGLNKPLTEPSAGIVEWMNKQAASRIIIDVPSGMMEAPLSVPELIVHADHVIAFQIPRTDLLIQRENYNPLSLHFVDIGLDKNAIESEPTKSFLIEEADVKKLLLKRRLFDNKWTYGHALIVAGSRKAMGAALLATGSCIRSGCGLVTTHTIKSGSASLNVFYPEAMFSPDHSDEMITDVELHAKFNAIGIGCGIGLSDETSAAVVDVLTKSKLPFVIDADALNLLAKHHAWKDLVHPGCILTPHAKEFDRLVGEQPNDYERMQKQIQLAQEINCVVIVKGAYTRIALPDGTCYFNSTGTPALATAGSGDVLTGLITGLLARGYTSKDAATIGVYVHGLAAQIASKKYGIECVKASDITEHLHEAFNQLYA